MVKGSKDVFENLRKKISQRASKTKRKGDLCDTNPLVVQVVLVIGRVPFFYSMNSNLDSMSSRSNFLGLLTNCTGKNKWIHKTLGFHSLTKKPFHVSS